MKDLSCSLLGSVRNDVCHQLILPEERTGARDLSALRLTLSSGDEPVSTCSTMS